MSLIGPDAKEIFSEKIKAFQVVTEEISARAKMRQGFTARFNSDRIKKLQPLDYFSGEGRKNDCLGYQLEWATRALGSIKGGSMAKYGAKDQFADIKKLLNDLASLTDRQSYFYETNGDLSKFSLNLVSQSLKIKGMKSGRTVLGKLLSIYYPNTFIPIFNEQETILEKVVKEYSDDSFGLELYLKNNFRFLQVRGELLAEPGFAAVTSSDQFTNDVFYSFLYHCFSRPSELTATSAMSSNGAEKIEALETEHYQNLIHRNFKRLFGGYRYYDEDLQNAHKGHYPTEDVGVMDFLCLDEKNNLVVIELKRKGTDETLAQLCRYMGWVKENLARDQQKVLGLIVAETKDLRLEYGLKVVPNVVLKQMRLDVRIETFEKN